MLAEYVERALIYRHLPIACIKKISYEYSLQKAASTLQDEAITPIHLSK